MTSSSPSPEKVLPDHAADHKDSTKDERTGEDFGGRIIENPEGSFVHRTTVSTAVRTDDPAYSDYLKEGSCWWTRLEDGFSLGDVVFLDTETTGLFGGAGSLAFLIGIGCFTEKGLIIEQYLMRDFDEEYPMLKSLLDRLKEFRVLVTFNGKSFDWPLLESRFIFSRLKATDWEDRHIDLLHLSRRLWSRCLENCSLSTIEKGILGLYREDDIPGYMIPKVYPEYLNTGDPAEMSRVLKHNEMDIAAMSALFLHISRLFQDPESRGDSFELLGIASELERNHKIQEAAKCYECCIRKARNQHIKAEAKKRYAYLMKRHFGPAEAMDVWEDIAAGEGNMFVYPYVEMAKYLEHSMKDFQKALDCTEKAIELAGRSGRQSAYVKKELLARKRRLLKKIERSRNKWA